MVGHDPTVGEFEELSVAADRRRLSIGRALLLDGLRSLHGQGAESARRYTEPPIRTVPTTSTSARPSGAAASTSATANRSSIRA